MNLPPQRISPNNRTNRSERLQLGWETVKVYPGQHLTSILHAYNRTNRVFELQEGTHEYYDVLLIDQPCMVVGTSLSYVRLHGANAKVHILTHGVEFMDWSIIRADDHVNHMLHIEGIHNRVQHISFENARVAGRGTLYYPVYFDAAAQLCSLTTSDFEVDTSAVGTQRMVYMHDNSRYNLVSACHFEYDLVGVTRNLVSFKSGRDNECGQSASAPAGTYRSFSNFGDVEIRP